MKKKQLKNSMEMGSVAETSNAWCEIILLYI